MKTRLLWCKILSASFIILLSNNGLASQLSSFVQYWQQKNFLVFGEPVKLDRLDPRLAETAHTKYTIPLIFEPLIFINPQQELRPVLAQSWLVSADNKSVIITLKQKHFFSDGAEVTAPDVVNSLVRICSPESKVYEEIQGLSGCVDYAMGSKQLPKVQVLGKYQLKFTINNSPTAFLYQLASANTAIVKETKSGLLGSGPYEIQEEKSDHVVLKRNPFYSDPDIVKNNGLVMFYLDHNNLQSVLEDSKPDGVLMYRMPNIIGFNSQNYKLIKSNPNITEMLVLNNQRYPFNIPLVRKAFATAVYDEMTYDNMRGAHKAYGIIPLGIGGSIDNVAPAVLPEIPPQELFAKVPSLVKKKTAVTIHLLEDFKNIFNGNQLTAIAKKYNIDMKFQYHPDYSTLEPLYFNHDLDGFIELYVFKNREAYSVFQFFTPSGENDANTNDKRFDAMLKTAMAASSSHERFQDYRALASYMQNNNMVIPLLYMDHGNLISKCLNGIPDGFFFNPYLCLSKITKINGCAI